MDALHRSRGNARLPFYCAMSIEQRRRLGRGGLSTDIQGRLYHLIPSEVPPRILDIDRDGTLIFFGYPRCLPHSSPEGLA